MPVSASVPGFPRAKDIVVLHAHCFDDGGKTIIAQSLPDLRALRSWVQIPVVTFLAWVCSHGTVDIADSGCTAVGKTRTEASLSRPGPGVHLYGDVPPRCCAAKHVLYPV